MGKVCNGCGDNSKRSDEWSLSGELAKYNKRLLIALLVVVFCWVATIAASVGLLWRATKPAEHSKMGEVVGESTNGSEKEICASLTMSGMTLLKTVDLPTTNLK